MCDHVGRLAASLQALDDGLVLVTTGAGVSAASGIATFRGAEPEAVWRVNDVEMATLEFFRKDPVAQWSWYLARFERVETASPNPAHAALAALEEWQLARGGDFQMVTQNIDTLHEAAGSRRLIKIHGTSDRVRCSRLGCPLGAPSGSIERERLEISAFRYEPGPKTLPRCPTCRAPLRAHVLFFDEFYQDHEDYRFEEALEFARRARLFLFVGTSFSVGITDMFLRIAAENGAPTFSVDPGIAPPGEYPIVHLSAAAEALLPRVADLVRAGEAVS